MASLSTRTYIDGQTFETLQGSDGSVTERVLEANLNRYERQLEAASKEPLFQWAGDGKVKQVGGNNPYRPAGLQFNSGLGDGDPVTVSKGLVSATPSAGNTIELQSQIKAQTDNLARVAKSLNGQAGSGDPNAETEGIKNVLPRYPNDTYYDEASGTLFIWDSDQESDPADPRWVPRYQLFQGFTGNPNDQSGAAVPVYLDGAIAVNAAGTKFTGNATNGTWQGQLDDLPGYIPEVENKTYPLGAASSYDLKILAVTQTGTSTATLATTPAIGSTVAAGGTMGLVVTNADGNDLAFTVQLERV